MKTYAVFRVKAEIVFLIFILNDFFLIMLIRIYYNNTIIAFFSSTLLGRIDNTMSILGS